MKQEMHDLCLLLADGNKLSKSELKHFNWDKIVGEAYWHRVIPLLIRKLDISSDSINIHNIPEDTFSELCNFRKENNKIVNFQIFELKILNDLFVKSGISFIVLKGLSLSKLIYDALQIRTSKDIDILINENDLEKVIELLEAANFKIDVPNTSNITCKRIFHKYYNQIQAWHCSRNICIEIHWKCTTNPHMFNPPSREIFEHSEPFNMSDFNIRTLPTSDTVVYIASHFARTHTLRLKWLCDMDSLVRNQKLNWVEIEALARKYSCTNALKSMIITCKKLFNTPIHLAENDLTCRIKVFVALNIFILNNKSKFSLLSQIRLLICGDNLRTFYHDFKSILSPRIHDPNLKVSGYGLIHMLYIRRIARLAYRILANILKIFALGPLKKEGN